MKVVHLVTYDRGGAYNAAKRISKALSNVVDSKIITFESKTEDEVCNTNLKKFYFKLLRKINYYLLLTSKKDVDFSHEFFSSHLCQLKVIQDADVIHLHWISSGMVSIGDLMAIGKMGKKLVWTLHDMYPMTGGCHYAGNCVGYIEGNCENCPRIKSSCNLANAHLTRMNDIVTNLDIKIVGCSTWISECARESLVFKNKEVVTIPNTIDFNRYYREQGSKRNKVVVFGAYLVNKDLRKGFDYFVEIARRIYTIDKNIKFKVFGNTDDVITLPNVEYLGMINDDDRMRKIYSEATISLSLSRDENLSCTIMESLACGTPVIAFDIGGNADLICDPIMGRLIEPYNLKSYIDAIIAYVDVEHKHKEIAKKTYDKFSEYRISEMYKKLYFGSINNGGVHE